jgi:endogenous inhibitor of DNA gyrase (YacG/DUF329 family)
MAQIACPTCGAVFETEQSRALPFCSPRCKQIDLGRWLNEEQRVPYEDLSDPDEASDSPGPAEPTRQ